MKVLRIVGLFLISTLAVVETKTAFELYKIRHNTVDQIISDIHNFQHQMAVKETLRKYRYVLNQPEIRTDKTNPYPDKVWILWHESYDKTPAIVKRCVESMKHYIKDRKIIFLHKGNVSDYIKVPNYIMEKYEKGIISHAHFADIVRIFLLREYGGLWMDASTYLTGSIPDWIWNSDFCAPHYRELEGKLSPNFTFKDLILSRVFDINFMHVKHPHNYVIDCMARFLEEFWKEHNECDYPFIMMFQAVAVEEDQKFRKICQDMLRNSSFSTRYHDSLGYKILEGKSYSSRSWQRIKKFPIHKIHMIAKIAEMDLESGTYGYKLVNG